MCNQRLSFLVRRVFVIPEKVQQFWYESLELATGGFNPTLYSAGGNLIGTGGFGQVFIGNHLTSSMAIVNLYFRLVVHKQH